MALTVRAEISEANADFRRVDELSRNLLREFRGLGIATERSAGEAPPGAKSGAAITIGTLVVAIANSPTAANLVSGILGWLERSRGRSIKLVHGDNSIELSSASSTQQRQLLAEWLEACKQTEKKAKTPEHSGEHFS